VAAVEEHPETLNDGLLSIDRSIIAKTAFLRVFARTGNVSLAARAAHCGRRTVYEWLDAD
jgi:hypothetical protein